MVSNRSVPRKPTRADLDAKIEELKAKLEKLTISNNEKEVELGLYNEPEYPYDEATNVYQTRPSENTNDPQYYTAPPRDKVTLKWMTESSYKKLKEKHGRWETIEPYDMTSGTGITTVLEMPDSDPRTCKHKDDTVIHFSMNPKNRIRKCHTCKVLVDGNNKIIKEKK